MNWDKAGHFADLLEKAINVFADRLTGIRTGRASTSLLDSVLVEAYGQKSPLKNLATVDIAGNMALNVKVFDQDNIKSVEKSIINANLGVSLVTEGASILIRIPPMTEETRLEMVKNAKNLLEDCKKVIRSIRQDAMGEIKSLLKNKEISEDESKDFQAEIEDLKVKFSKQAENKYELKAKEVTTL